MQPTTTSASVTAGLSRDDVLAILNVDDFRAWLAERDANAIVGHCSMPGACPLRNFLSDRGVPQPVVTANMVDWELDCGPSCWPNFSFGTVQLPEWAYRFVRGVDRLHPLSYEPHPRVTAADALTVLDSIGALEVAA